MHRRFQKAKRVVKQLIQAGHQAMIVGGAVRDHVMGKIPVDFDIATSAHPDQIENLFEKTIEVGKQFGVMIVCVGRDQFEVATFRKDLPYHDGRRPSGVTFTNAREDVLRRDFTINGLFWDPQTGEIIDYVGGQEDMARQKVRCIGDPMARFKEDHLRVLRAVRFAANLDFTIEEATWKALCTSAHLLQRISVERIRTEFEKIILRGNPLKGIQYLKQGKLLDILLPEDWCEPLRESGPFLFDALWQDPPASLQSLEGRLALFYIGWNRFFRYDRNKKCLRVQKSFEDSVKALQKFLKKMTFTNKTIQITLKIIQMLKTVLEMPRIDKATARRILGHAGGSEVLEICVHLEKTFTVKTSKSRRLKQVLRQHASKPLLPKPLINGHDLQKLGVQPDLNFAKWMDIVYDYQLNHESVTRVVLKSWLEKQLMKTNNP